MNNHSVVADDGGISPVVHGYSPLLTFRRFFVCVFGLTRSDGDVRAVPELFWVGVALAACLRFGRDPIAFCRSTLARPDVGPFKLSVTWVRARVSGVWMALPRSRKERGMGGGVGEWGGGKAAFAVCTP